LAAGTIFDEGLAVAAVVFYLGVEAYAAAGVGHKLLGQLAPQRVAQVGVGVRFYLLK
jgi:hypothetical protein